MSRLLLHTLRDPPGDAEAASHQLLVRGGYIRRLASGVYTYLPLGWRVLQRIEQVVRQEMDGAGGQEMLMPVLHPEEVWAATGRLGTMEDVLFRLEGHGGSFVLGPTHEEVVTATVAAEVDSYRDLPLNVYQIQLKYRDEARPRFGLLRCREFVMKDAYTFDVSQEAMRLAYQAMYDAYCRIFDRLGLQYVPVEAQAGAIGGDVNHEFMVPSAIGEDLFARCNHCGYAANVEAATAGERSAPSPGADEPLTEHHTPGRPGIDLVVEHFADRGLTAAGMLKCLALKDGNGQVVVALVPGDRDVRLDTGMVAFTDEDFDEHPYLIKGYIGPMGLQAHDVRVMADHAVKADGPWVTGANRPDHHVTGASLDRDFQVDAWGSIATVAAGDPCPRCGQPLELVRAVEAGHTFQLGLTYSTKIPNATFVDQDGRELPYWMGCYGIGISRNMAVIAEEHHDDAGLIWPAGIAPFQMHLMALGAHRSPDVASAADRLYEELSGAGVEVLYDDRDVAPGVKFNDADLLGMPVQLIVGGKGLARGVVERKDRRSGHRDELPVEGVITALKG